MHSRSAVFRVLVAASLLCTSSIVRAQQRDTLGSHMSASAVFRGRVIQQGDSTPVANADVWLPSLDRHASTDSAGAFRFDGLPAGLQLVQIRRVGLDAQRDTIALSAEHENVRTYALAEQSTKLDTVRTMAGAQKYLSPMLRGFEERRLSGQGGHFISDSVLRKNENMTAANLIASRIPGLTQQFIILQGKGVIRALVSTRKQCKGLALQGCGGKPNCFVAIYLDGVLRYSTKLGIDPPDLSKEYDISSLAGIEYYAGAAAAPIAMHSDDDGCGSLWLWTRER